MYIIANPFPPLTNKWWKGTRHSMTRITDLPAELLLFITQYLIDGRETGSYFASANRSLSRELLKKVRRINICVTSQKWVSEDTRSKLLQMIDNPYHQFSLCDDRHSFTDIYYSSLFLLPGINKLQIPASLLPILTNQVNEKKFILKSLAELSFSDFVDNIHQVFHFFQIIV